MSSQTYPGIEQHPDILALRIRSERAVSTVPAQIMEGLGLLTGLYLAASAWVVGFHTTLTGVAVTNLIAGLAYAFFTAGGFGSAHDRTHAMSWTAAAIGVWAIITPWVVSGPSNTTAVVASNCAAGTLAVVFAVTTAILAMMHRRRS